MSTPTEPAGTLPHGGEEPSASGSSGPRRVLFFHQGAELYGSDRVLLNLAASLSREGNRVLVLLPEEGPLVPALRREGIAAEIMPFPVIRRRDFRGLGPARFLLSLFLTRGAVSRRAAAFDPHLVCTNTGTVLTGALWARRKRLPHVWLVHEIWRGGRWGRAVFSRVIGGLSAAVVAPSRAVARDLAAGWPGNAGRTEVIPNGIPLPPGGPVPGPPPAADGLPPGSIRVGIVGRFNRWKGQRELVPVMAAAAARDARLGFLFAGGAFRGDEGIVDDFRRLVREAGLEARVRVLGEVPDTADLYRRLDILVHPAVLPEPFGLVLLEAMAAGVPVAAYDHGGPSEILDSSCGILVPPGDREALADAIVALAADPARRARLGAAGAERVRREYTVGRQGRCFAGLLRSLAGGTGR